MSWGQGGLGWSPTEVVDSRPYKNSFLGKGGGEAVCTSIEKNTRGGEGEGGENNERVGAINVVG